MHVTKSYSGQQKNEMKNWIYATSEKVASICAMDRLLDDRLITDQNLTLSVWELVKDLISLSDIYCVSFVCARSRLVLDINQIPFNQDFNSV